MPTQLDDYETLLEDAKRAYQRFNLQPITRKFFRPGSKETGEPGCACLTMAIAIGRRNVEPPNYDEFKSEQDVKNRYFRSLPDFHPYWRDGVIDGWDGSHNYLEEGGIYQSTTEEDERAAREAYAAGYTLGRMGRERILVPFQKGERPF